MPKAWLLTGSKEQWLAAFQNGNIWGLPENQYRIWERIEAGDLVFFRVTAPIKGIVGYGVVKCKFKEYTLRWPDEVREQRPKWVLRFSFDVKKCLELDEWPRKALMRSSAGTYIQLLWGAIRGTQRISSEEAIKALLAFFEANPLSIPSPPHVSNSITTPVPVVPQSPIVAPSAASSRSISVHRALIDKLVEIGRMKKYLADSEYPMDTGRLDVVWRRIEKSVPMFAFEVQVGGDLSHALGRLKHAYDLFQSRLFLVVVAQEDRAKAEQLLAGTFHEIRNRVRIIDSETLEQLYQWKRKYKDLEEQLGLE